MHNKNLSKPDDVLRKNNKSLPQNSSAAVIKSLLASNNNLVGATAAGLSSAVLFNFWDCAYFNAIKYKRNFLSIDNFKTPFKAVGQSISYRMVSSGSFYLIQGKVEDVFKPYIFDNYNVSKTTVNFTGGIVTGCMVGSLVNVLGIIRNQTWGDKSSKNFCDIAASMYYQGGLSAFARGVSTVIFRDMIFAATYEGIRYELNYTSLDPVASNFIASSFGMIFSSPFNYVKTIQHAASVNKPAPSMKNVFVQLGADVKSHSSSFLGRANYLCNSRLFMFGGMVRVACATTFGQYVCDDIKNRF